MPLGNAAWSRGTDTLTLELFGEPRAQKGTLAHRSAYTSYHLPIYHPSLTYHHRSLSLWGLMSLGNLRTSATPTLPTVFPVVLTPPAVCAPPQAMTKSSSDSSDKNGPGEAPSSWPWLKSQSAHRWLFSLSLLIGSAMVLCLTEWNGLAIISPGDRPLYSSTGKTLTRLPVAKRASIEDLVSTRVLQVVPNTLKASHAVAQVLQSDYERFQNTGHFDFLEAGAEHMGGREVEISSVFETSLTDKATGARTTHLVLVAFPVMRGVKSPRCVIDGASVAAFPISNSVVWCGPVEFPHHMPVAVYLSFGDGRRSPAVLMQHDGVLSPPPLPFVNVTACSLASNEESLVTEWIDYHKRAGVDRIVLYVDETVPRRDTMGEVLQPYLESGLLIRHSWWIKSAQTQALSDCLNRYRDSSEWVALYDIDEFIVTPPGQTVAEALRHFEEAAKTGALCVPIWFYCSPDARKREVGKTVFDRFPYRLRDGGWKPFVRPEEALTVMSFGPHFAQPIEYLSNERQRTMIISIDDCLPTTKVAGDLHLRHYRWLSLEEHVHRRRGPDSVFFVNRTEDSLVQEWEKSATECRNNGTFDEYRPEMMHDR